MKKILLIGGVAAIVVAAAYYLYPQQQTTTSPGTISGNSAPTSSTAILLPNFSFTATDNDGSGKATNANNTTISFRGSPPYDAQNEAFSVFAGNKQIGPTGAEGGTIVSRLGFSPDGNYFAVRVLGVSGAYRYDTHIGIVDLLNNKYKYIEPKVQAPQYASSGIEFWDLSPYVSFYKWSGSSTLDTTSYLLGTKYDQTEVPVNQPVNGIQPTVNRGTITYYRVSPIEVWRYDLSTGSSTLIQTTP
jgi:hypothetical protein